MYICIRLQYIVKFIVSICKSGLLSQGPHSHILMMGSPSDFFGSTKDARLFLGCKKKDQGIFLGMQQNIVIFVGIQILKL